MQRMTQQCQRSFKGALTGNNPADPAGNLFVFDRNAIHPVAQRRKEVRKTVDGGVRCRSHSSNVGRQNPWKGKTFRIERHCWGNEGFLNALRV